MDTMIIDMLKAAFLGVVEGVTEFLPVSSTGHLLIANQFVHFDNKVFGDMFDIVIQLGAILAIVVIYFKRLNPFSPKLTPVERTTTWNLWGKACVAFVPTGIAAFLLNDWINTNFFNAYTVAFTLIFYGVVFIAVELLPKKTRVETVDAFPYWLALALGVIQILSLVPGTSRSGITIIGALLLGVGRVAAAEFTFFLAIPTMVVATGYSLLKYLRDTGWHLVPTEMAALAVGFLVSFLVAWAVVKAFIRFIQKDTFIPFGVYRMVAGAAVLGYFALTGAAVYR